MLKIQNNRNQEIGFKVTYKNLNKLKGDKIYTFYYIIKCINLEYSMKTQVKRSIKTIQNYRMKVKWNNKLKHIFNNNQFLKTATINKTDRKNIKRYYGKYKLKPNLRAFQVYKYFNSDFNLAEYISDDIFHIYVEKFLNRRDLSSAYEDKNFLDKIFPSDCLPKTVFRNINGYFYTKEYKSIDISVVKKLIKNCKEDIILKPTIDSAGGYGVQLYKICSQNGENEKDRLISYIENDTADYIVQNKIIQDKSTNRFYKDSVNTFRVITCIVGDEVVPLSTVFRMGSNSYIDNFSSGGICSGIDKHGKMSDFAIDKFYNKHFSHPSSGLLFKEYYFEYYQEIIEFAKKMHRLVPFYFKLISWDIAINEKGKLILIEMNLFPQQIDFHQIHNGPLFGDYIESILNEIII